MSENKKILITGGTGSFGNAFLKGAVKSEFYSEIRIFSRDEKKQDDLRKDLNNSKIKFVKFKNSINLRSKILFWLFINVLIFEKWNIFKSYNFV